MEPQSQYYMFDVLKTITIDYYHYVDVVNDNGVIKTQLMKKISEPNEFAIAHAMDGDVIDEMVEYYKNTKDAANG